MSFRYAHDSPELQMRQLGDLAFLLQNYELSYQTYNSVRKDYQVDHAWLLYAGAVVSSFPQSKCTQTGYVINTFCDSPLTGVHEREGALVFSSVAV